MRQNSGARKKMNEKWIVKLGMSKKWEEQNHTKEVAFRGARLVAPCLLLSSVFTTYPHFHML